MDLIEAFYSLINYLIWFLPLKIPGIPDKHLFCNVVHLFQLFDGKSIENVYKYFVQVNNFFAEEHLLYIVRKLLENSVFQSTFLGAKYFLSIELQSIFLKKFFHQQLLGEPPGEYNLTSPVPLWGGKEFSSGKRIEEKREKRRRKKRKGKRGEKREGKEKGKGEKKSEKRGKGKKKLY